MLCSDFSKDYTSGTYIGKEGVGHRLGEKEKYEYTFELYTYPHVTDHPETHDLLFSRTMWFEDTTGRKYRIKRIRKYLKER